MENYIHTISVYRFVLYVGVGILMYLLLGGIHRYIIPLLKKKHRVDKLWNRLRILLWIVYACLFYTSLFMSNMLLVTIFTVVFIGLGWEYWRNIFAGVLLQFNDRFKKGDTIITDFISGKFKAIHLARSEIQNEKGEWVSVPNKKLLGATAKHLHKKNGLQTQSFTLKATEYIGKNEVYRFVLNCPYIAAHRDINIQKKNRKTYHIKVAVIDKFFVEKVEEYFEKFRLNK